MPWFFNSLLLLKSKLTDLPLVTTYWPVTSLLPCTSWAVTHLWTQSIKFKKPCVVVLYYSDNFLSALPYWFPSMMDSGRSKINSVFKNSCVVVLYYSDNFLSALPYWLPSMMESGSWKINSVAGCPFWLRQILPSLIAGKLVGLVVCIIMAQSKACQKNSLVYFAGCVIKWNFVLVKYQEHF